MRQNELFFLEKFDLFADAPNAVEQLRELLVHLAVIGKLVTNCPDEEAIGLNLSAPIQGQSILPTNWRSGLLGDVGDSAGRIISSMAGAAGCSAQ